MAAKKRNARTSSRTKATEAKQTLTQPVSATAPVGDQDSTAEKVHRALRGIPGGTAAQIALAAGVAGPTARKTLAALALQKLANREQSGQRGVADRWHAVESAPDTAPAQDENQADGVESTTASEKPSQTEAAAEPAAEVNGKDQGTRGDTTDDDATEDATHKAEDTTSGGDPASPATTITTPRADTATAAGRQERLAPGALRGQVEDWLRDHPSQSFGPTEISHKLGRSSGAIANALEKLVADGVAVRTNTAPKRYRLRGDTNA